MNLRIHVDSGAKIPTGRASTLAGFTDGYAAMNAGRQPTAQEIWDAAQAALCAQGEALPVAEVLEPAHVMPFVRWHKRVPPGTKLYTAPPFGVASANVSDGDMTRIAKETGLAEFLKPALPEEVLCRYTEAILARAPAATVADPNKQTIWRCFHCDEAFSDAESAALHFGTTELQSPACTIDIAEYRAMEQRMRSYVEEDTALHREIHGLQAQHQTALMREEEKGYARGLADGIKEATQQLAATHEPHVCRIQVQDGKILSYGFQQLDGVWADGEHLLYHLAAPTQAVTRCDEEGVRRAWTAFVKGIKPKFDTFDNQNMFFAGYQAGFDTASGRRDAPDWETVRDSLAVFLSGATGKRSLTWYAALDQLFEGGALGKWRAMLAPPSSAQQEAHLD